MTVCLSIALERELLHVDLDNKMPQSKDEMKKIRNTRFHSWIPRNPKDIHKQIDLKKNNKQTVLTNTNNTTVMQ